jgi:hypothetical protein
MRHAPTLTLCILLGCSGKAQDTGAEPRQDHNIWAGWNLTWDTLSHRVSSIRTIATAEGGASLGIRGGDWSTGESWSDQASYRVHLQRVTSAGIQVVHGESWISLGPEGSASIEEQVEVSGEVVDIVLRGFEIETDVPQEEGYPDYDPALGYTSRGFGFSVGPATLEDEEAHFTVSAQLRWGPRDRDDMNTAMLLAQSSVRVAWTAIGHNGSSTVAALAGEVDLEHAPPYSEQAGIRLASELGDSPGIAGITGFDLVLSDQDGGDGGDYLRSFGVELDLNDDGAPPLTALAEMTTSSILELGTMHFAPQVQLIWIRPDSPDLKVEPFLLEGTLPVGATEIDPTK